MSFTLLSRCYVHMLLLTHLFSRCMVSYPMHCLRNLFNSMCGFACRVLLYTLPPRFNVHMSVLCDICIIHTYIQPCKVHSFAYSSLPCVVLFKDADSRMSAKALKKKGFLARFQYLNMHSFEKQKRILDGCLFATKSFSQTYIALRGTYDLLFDI
jgi:hypothetical protein